MAVGTLFVGSTPIGNTEDFSLRMVSLLKDCDLLILETASRILPILNDGDIEYNKNYVEFRDPTPSEDREAVREKNLAIIEYVLDNLNSGKRVLLITDEGTPLLNDPGLDILGPAASAGHVIEVVPGPSAVIASVIHAMSFADGQSQGAFAFLPSMWAEADVIKNLLPIKDANLSIVLALQNRFFLDSDISDWILDVLGNRDVIICQDITKESQRISKSNLKSLKKIFANDKKFIQTSTTIVILPKPYCGVCGT